MFIIGNRKLCSSKIKLENIAISIEISGQLINPTFLNYA